MPNTLQHEDIYPGMSFKGGSEGDYTKQCTVVYMQRDDVPCPFLVVWGTLKVGDIWEKASEWVSLDRLNEMQFLGIQTEPVQLGVVEDVDGDGEPLRYYGTSGRYLFLSENDGTIFKCELDNCKIINAPKPEIPKEIPQHGMQSVPKDPQGV